MIASAMLAIASPGLSKPLYGTWGYDPTAMDAAVKPGDDFFSYVNGAWFKRTAIAPDRTFAGIDSILNDQIDKDVRQIADDMAKNPSGHIGQQIGDLYASWMDQDAGEKLVRRHSSHILRRSPPRRREAILSTCSLSPDSIPRSTLQSTRISRTQLATPLMPLSPGSACSTAIITC
jgi:hypothetical protein